MRLFQAILFMSVLVLYSCNSEDIATPKIVFSSPSTGAKILHGSAINIQYEITDNASIKEHSLEIFDGEGNSLEKKDMPNNAGRHSYDYTIPSCNIAVPIIVRVLAKDVNNNVAAKSVSVNSSLYTMKINLEYDGNPLVYLKEYEYPNGKKIEFSRASFFLSNIGIGDRQEDCVHYINFSNAGKSLNDASKGVSVPLYSAEEGTYSALSFMVGVDANDNDRRPADFPATSPLSESGEYWNGWKSYVFLKLEGKIDLDDNPTDKEQAFSLHIGGNKDSDGNAIPAAMNIRLDNPFTLSSDSTELNVVLDVKKAFVDGDKVYDIATTPATHALRKKEYMLELVANLSKAFSLKK